MNKFWVIFFSVVLTFLQLTVTPMVKLGWLNYNFALVCMTVVCLLTDKKTGITCSIFVALIYDIFATVIPGTYFIVYVVISFIVIAISQHMLGTNWWITAIFIFVATLISELVIYWSFYAFKGMVYSAFVLSKIILPQCLINSIVGVIIFWFYKSVLRSERG